MDLNRKANVAYYFLNILLPTTSLTFNIIVKTIRMIVNLIRAVCTGNCLSARHGRPLGGGGDPLISGVRHYGARL